MTKRKLFKRNNTQNNKPSVVGSVGHGMATGFGLGAGIEGARAVFNGMAGSNTENKTESNTKCVFEKEQLEKCISNNNECKDFIELLNNCYKAK
jgi:hypothetical protein